MFANINKKLTDHSFLQEAIDQSKQEVSLKEMEDYAEEDMDDSTMPVWMRGSVVMNEEDIKCYEQRYAVALQGMPGDIHYAKLGKRFGLHAKCGNRMTGIRAKRYLGRYPQLQSKFGYFANLSIQEAIEHWTSAGYKNQSFSYKPLEMSEEPYHLADATGNERDGWIFNCEGRTWYGLREHPITKEPITTFDEMIMYKTKSKDTD